MKILARVKTEEQLKCVLQSPHVTTVVCSLSLFERNRRAIMDAEKEIVLDLPKVLREKRKTAFEKQMGSVLKEDSVLKGVVADNTDVLGYLKEIDYQGTIYAGEFLYSYNKESIAFYESCFERMEFFAPAELTLMELEELQQASGKSLIFKLYGYQTLMVTAQCLHKNYKGCLLNNKQESEAVLKFTDRKQETFFAFADCKNCYDEIFNGTPTSMLDRINEIPGKKYLVDFTVESRSQSERILKDLDRALNGAAPSQESLTRGHFYKKID